MDGSTQHRHAMAIPHRRPAYGVNAPALFRHVGFRIEDPQENPLTAGQDRDVADRRKVLVAKLNDSLATLQDRCETKQRLSFCMSDDDASDTAIPIANTLLNTLDRLPDGLADWRARLRVDIHSEYYFITLILDQRSGQQCVPDIGEAERLLSTKGCTSVDTKSFIKKYYEEVWNDLGVFLAEGFGKLPGERFTEFRSIALRDTESPFVKERHQSLDRFTIPQMDAPEFGAARRSMRDWLTCNAPCIHEILQVQAFTRNVDQDANCVLCEMLDGAGVYGSSVRQVPAGGNLASSTKELRPLRYFLLYNGLSKYQLGRLVRRTHVMGELRVAAVLDAVLLDQASSRIRSLGNNIDTLLKNPGGVATISNDEFNSVLRELNRINSLVPGGLMYRINRSRYYANAFRERMPDMRVKRLEGWQPYDEFFQRNLYQVFNEIHQIGIRYEALSERVSRLIIARKADRLRRSQENIQMLVHEMTAADRTIAKIQELGEWIGFVAVTYYGGHIFAEILRALDGEEHLIRGFVIAGGIALVVRFLWHRSHEKEERETRAPETAPSSAPPSNKP